MNSSFSPEPSEGRLRHELETLLDRASRDAAFRALCLSDPAAAIRQAVGIDLPGDFVVRFVENRGADLTIVLRDMVADDDALSDEDLDLAAGGTGPMW